MQKKELCLENPQKYFNVQIDGGKKMRSTIEEILTRNPHVFGGVLTIDYRTSPIVVLDLSKENQAIKGLNFSDHRVQSAYINDLLERNGAQVAIGRYNEDRSIYDHSPLFSGTERRTIHLGNDLFVPAGTAVLCPYDATLHSYKNNVGIGDYGPTIILQHTLEGETFYTLYGHLSVDSLDGLHEGKPFRKGDHLGTIGDPSINGGWPPHLHFEIITDMLGMKGDFPGVASLSTREKYLALCPDPNLMLQFNIP